MTSTGEPANAATPFANLLARRWSCRAFEPTPVPRPVIEDVLRQCQRSPSWCNTQPWKITVTTGDETDRLRRALARADGAESESDYPFPAEYVGIYAERRRRCGHQLYAAVGVERHDRPGRRGQAALNFQLFGAPHVLIVTVDRAMGPYAVLDTGVYLGHLLLAIADHGLGAIPQASLARHSALIRRHFGIADDRAVLLGVSFGYPDLADPVNTFRTERANLDEVVTWHGYEPPRE